MAGEKVQTGVKFTQETRRQIEELVDAGLYATYSDFIREAVRIHIRKVKRQQTLNAKREKE